MKVQFLNGGLGNQAFQYIFLRFAELYHPGDIWYMDDSYFYLTKDMPDAGKYELEKVFGIKPKLLSQEFDDDVWQDILRMRRRGFCMADILAGGDNAGKLIISECRIPDKIPTNIPTVQLTCNVFNPEITAVNGLDVYYHGYWINKHWFFQFREELLREFKFPPITDPQNLMYAEEIKRSEAVAIHVRRGDFVKLGLAIADSFYRQATALMVEKEPDATFFVFSDDPDWCKEHAKDCGFDKARETRYIEGNTDGKNYIDMQLMTYCKHMIMSNSSFCYLAALLNQNLQNVVNPTDREV